MSLIQALHRSLPGYRLRQSLRRAACVLPGTSRYPLVADHTWLPPARLKALEQHVAYIERQRVPGAVVECGVAAGGSAAVLGMALDRWASQRALYLFDTFEGLPAPSENDPDYEKAVQWTGQCRGTLEDVQSFFAELRMSKTRLKFVPGLFQDTLPQTATGSIALAHLDGDWYESTLTCLKAVWPQLSVGGVMQLDDYGTWQGCRTATDEFFAALKDSISIAPIDDSAIVLRRVR
jgi:O-methyltransferase